MSVVLAAIGAISRHNVNPVSGDAPRYGVATEAPNLPSLDTLMKSFKQSLVSGPLKEIEKHLSLPQERFCMAHGCVQASKDPVITLQDCGAGCLDFGQVDCQRGGCGQISRYDVHQYDVEPESRKMPLWVDVFGKRVPD